DQLTFKFCDRREDREHKPAIGSGRVNVFVQAHELDSEGIKFVQRIDQMARTASESVESVDHHDIECAAPRVIPQGIEARPVFLRAGNAAVEVPADLPAAGLTEADQLA